MKTSRISLLLLTGLFLLIAAISSKATLVEEYFPLNDGDVKYYEGPAGDIYLETQTKFGFNPTRHDMVLYLYEEPWTDEFGDEWGGEYYEEARYVVGHSTDKTELREYGAEMGWNNFTWSPVVTTLTDDLIANGGSLTFQSTVIAPGTNIPVTVTITVTSSGTVTVPAGKFINCKTVSFTAKITGTSLVVSGQAWVLAPKVGQIKIGIVNESGKIVAWESLTEGTVGGTDVVEYANQIAPVLAITSPTPNQKVSLPVFTVAGTAKDNTQVTEVWYRVNGGNWSLAQTTNGWTNWTATANLQPGSNSISAYATDPMDNMSPVKTVNFTYVLSAPLTLSTNGSGTISGATNGQLLEIGRSYTLVAKPSLKNLFVNWSGSQSSDAATLAFIMQSNMTFTANFVTNPFVALKGKFNGLFREYSPQRHQDNSGAFLLTLTEPGAYSASVQIGAKKYPGKGTFDWLGRSQFSFKPSISSTVTVALELDVTNLTATVNGNVTDGIWQSPLLGNRAPVYPTGSASPFAGKYTMVIPGSEDAAQSPGGDSYGLVSITPAGVLKLAGKLADGTTAAQTVPVSAEGWWPVYVPLYSGKGSLHGWMRFTNDINTDLMGGLNWIKQAIATAKHYPLGFTNQHDSVGSLYVTPTTNRVVDITDGTMTFLHGNLIQPITNNVLLTADNKITNLGSNKLAMTFTLSSGLFKGSVVDTNTAKAIPFTGVLLQKLDAGYGFFLGTNQSGQAMLSPSP